MDHQFEASVWHYGLTILVFWNPKRQEVGTGKDMPLFLKDLTQGHTVVATCQSQGIHTKSIPHIIIYFTLNRDHNLQN